MSQRVCRAPLPHRAPIDKATGPSLDALVMLASLGLILLCQLIGEAFARGVGLPLPGPVLGLLLLLVLLIARDRFKWLKCGPLQNAGVETASKGLLTHLSLLFVPAGVGVVQELDLLASHGIAIVLVLAASVVVTLLATVLTFRLVSRLLQPRDAR